MENFRFQCKVCNSFDVVEEEDWDWVFNGEDELHVKNINLVCNNCQVTELFKEA